MRSVWQMSLTCIDLSWHIVLGLTLAQYKPHFFDE